MTFLTFISHIIIEKHKHKSNLGENKKMISSPRHGWCTFSIGKDKDRCFTDRASYLTNVPVDLLDAFVTYTLNGYGCVVFDAEGYEYTLVLTAYNQSIYIIDENNHLIDFSDLNADDLARELIKDIESDLENWISFATFDKDEEEENRSNINRLLSLLKQEYFTYQGGA